MITFDIKKVVKGKGRSKIKYIYHTVLKDGKDYTKEYAKLWDTGINEDGTVGIVLNKTDDNETVVNKILERVNKFNSKDEWLSTIK